MGDYPDYTRAEQIVGTDIQVAVDIQGAYIMMPVDIQAQYITLQIDIVAQSVGNIAVDITAQTLGTLAVDITAATIGNLNINFNAQGTAVYFGGEWNIIQGNGVSLSASAVNQSFSGSASATRTTTAGKKLYINSIGFYGTAYAAANGDQIQNCTGAIEDNTTSTILWQGGGAGGGGVTFPAPIEIPSGHQLGIIAQAWGNHAMNIGVSIQGWEI